MRTVRSIIASGALAVGLLAGTVAAATPAHAATNLGGVSIWNACVYQHGTPSDVVNVTGDVMGWRCFYNGGWNGILYGVDLNRECKRVHGNAAYASYTNFQDEYSWRCYK